ncbi:receptor-type tyrosine-protein phosphatase c [Plakobranchus ocellatus]|uniref:Receptor-type tyrosine-protein phosphatase c n=1 Tax=Plakobranchus ocellatus TaxID=259542 RepID=A0AAV4BSR9_9GAST|nr:receptor-type tyrosine-protein phosphatase c [Plakobranchus ocellatus]
MQSPPQISSSSATTLTTTQVSQNACNSSTIDNQSQATTSPDVSLDINASAMLNPKMTYFDLSKLPVLATPTSPCASRLSSDDLIRNLPGMLSSGALESEFQNLPKVFPFSFETGKSECVAKKNRDRGVVPYDHNRVILTSSEFEILGEDGADYINASFIRETIKLTKREGDTVREIKILICKGLISECEQTEKEVTSAGLTGMRRLILSLK